MPLSISPLGVPGKNVLYIFWSTRLFMSFWLFSASLSTFIFMPLRSFSTLFDRVDVLPTKNTLDTPSLLSSFATSGLSVLGEFTRNGILREDAI